jgi:Fe-S cluster assembly protein SufD
VIQVEHVGRNSRSEQVLRGVANGQSSIGLASRVDVAASAGGADSRQSLKGLIGAAGAEVNLRPQLEINTDEVKASHGATTGSLDDNTLFYLLSRGIDPETARKLLEWAFIGDVMSHIDIAGLRRQVELTTVSQLGNSAALEALL